jgi:uncharacterized repeat protein (TIGR03803 family)
VATFPALANGINFDGAYPQMGTSDAFHIYGTASSGGTNGHGTIFSFIQLSDDSAPDVLYTFSTPVNGANADGAAPAPGVLLLGQTLYGTAAGGGTAGHGTIFALNTSTRTLTNLHSFAAGEDGAAPQAGLVLAGGRLFGTTTFDGTGGWGTVFSVGTNGDGFQTLYSFTNGSDGGVPSAPLIVSSNTLYSTSSQNGTGSFGTVFKINTDGSSFAALYVFSGKPDGAIPLGALLLLDGTLYGTTSQGGANGHGTVFSIKTDGSGYTILHQFSATTAIFNTDGAAPYGNLVAIGESLYGTARLGGKHGFGVIFTLKTSGAGFANINDFSGGKDGGWPRGELLVISDRYFGTLYGATSTGGDGGVGTAFELWPSAGTPPPLPTVTIKTIAIPPHAGIATGSGKYLSPSTVTLTATATNGCYSFTKWTVGAKTVSTNPVYTFTPNLSEVLVANFSAYQYSIEAKASPTNGGIIVGTGTKTCGSAATLVARAEPGFKFANWIANNVVQSGKPVLTFEVDGDATLTANFLDIAPPTVAFTSPINGLKTTNSTITVNGKAHDNAFVENVYVKVGTNGVWTPAQETGNAWSTWTATVNLSTGLNLLEAYAVDSSGNTNLPVSLKIDRTSQ